MNEQEAKQRLEKYLKFLTGDIGYHKEPSWLTENPEFIQLNNGDWYARNPREPHNGVLLKSDGKEVPFFGALGKFVDGLGPPVAREYFLASASHGRYQAYDRGLAVWEEVKDVNDLGYQVAKWESIDKRTRSCRALIAFFDLRGFTKWASSQDATGIQNVIELVEQSFQDAFSRRWCIRLFAKGTGDGFMVVSEAGWYATSEQTTDDEFHAGHTKAFCQACAETIGKAAEKIPAELAIGCGVTIGQITQLYLLGRFDYIGSPVNEASKIQAIAYNELCVSAEVVSRLQREGVQAEGKVLPDKGMRVTSESLIRAEAKDKFSSK